jgi:hypothetical protein
MKIENHTPLQAAWLVLLDKQGAERLIVALKATYVIAEDGRLSIAPKQDALRGPDEFHGEPGQSSIRYEGELGPPKVATDVALVGSAVAPGPGIRTMEVSFRVGPLHKRVRVYGERRWRRVLGLLSHSAPEPFERVPLIFENAFGGTDASAPDPKHHDREPRNPVGRGFIAKRSQLELPGSSLPNIEDPEEPFRRPGQRVTPQGFGFIGRDWNPRASYAGTYDQRWMEDRLPLLPLDFDERHHNAAHPDLIAPGFLRGNEPVEIIGCTRSGRLAFNLPNVQPAADAMNGKGREAVRLKLNTVLVDTDTMRLSLLWKGDLDIHKRLLQFTAITCRLG